MSPPSPVSRALEADLRDAVRRLFAGLGLGLMSLACAGVGAAEGPLLPIQAGVDGSFVTFSYSDSSGRIVGPADLSAAHRHHEGLAWASQGEFGSRTWGIVGEDGRWVVPPSLTYDQVEPFAGGVARVRRGKAWGLVNREGVEVVPPQYTSIGAPEDGWMVAGIEGNRCVYLRPDGEVVGELEKCGDFSEGRAAVREDYAWRYVDTSLNPLDAGPWDEAHPYAEGYAVVRPTVTMGPQQQPTGPWHIIDRGGRTVGVIDDAHKVSAFSDGVAIVSDTSGNWFAGPDGKPVFERVFSRARSFSEGLALVEIEEAHFGYADRSGELRIPGPLSAPDEWYGHRAAAVDFQGGVAWARPARTETWGLVDRDGRWVAPPRFEQVEPFHEGWARVKEGKAEWWIATDGRLRSIR